MGDLSFILVPLLFGMILLTTLCRALTFWQMERTPRVFVFFMVFLSLCLLYLVAAVESPMGTRDAVRTMLLLSLAVGNYLDWRALLSFLRKKYERKVAAGVAPVSEPVELTKTLATLADEKGPVKLDATENERVEAPLVSAKGT